MENEILSECIILSDMRIVQERKIQNVYYKEQKRYLKTGKCNGTIEELMILNDEEEALSAMEEEFVSKYEGTDVPKYTDVKTYSEVSGVPKWKIYREIKAGLLSAEKIKGKWRIDVSVDGFGMVA